MICIMTLPGNPVTKKNSQRILKNGRTGAHFVAPSSNFVYYQNCCLIYLRRCSGIPEKPIDYKVNVRCLYFMETRHRVDLLNLLESTMDILVKARILADDNSTIVAGHDGSRVILGCGKPGRVDIYIEELKDE